MEGGRKDKGRQEDETYEIRENCRTGGRKALSLLAASYRDLSDVVCESSPHVSTFGYLAQCVFSPFNAAFSRMRHSTYIFRQHMGEIFVVGLRRHLPPWRLSSLMTACYNETIALHEVIYETLCN